MPRWRQSPPDDLWLTTTDLSSLQASWARVLSNHGAAGGDRLTVDRFAVAAPQRLLRLSTELRNGRWRPGPARPVDIPKRKGGTRRLMIPCVPDRVVQGALGHRLSAILEPTFSEASYGYRPGRSVEDARVAIGRWRDKGYWHVVEADIVAFFDNVRHERLLSKLDAALAGHSGGGKVTDLIALILQGHAQDSGIQGRGVPQGSPLSPLLSNLYLDALDDAIDGKGLRLIRYADDFIILARRRETAELALAEAKEVLAAEGLELHAAGSRVRDFDRGFAFLGDIFVRGFRLPASDEREDDPISALRAVAKADAKTEMDDETESSAGYDRGTRVLYLSEPGRKLAVEGHAFAVLAEAGHRLAGISPSRVGRIEVGPGVEVLWGAMRLALDRGIPIALVGFEGETAGLWSPSRTERAGLHLSQARAVLNHTFSVAIALAIVDARIRNQRTQLFRLNREAANAEVTATLATMRRQLAKLSSFPDAAALRGAEGYTSAQYWQALARLADGAPVPFRRSRPAKDALNAAINYLTGLLERDMIDAVAASGLHPGFGFLHSAQDGNVALVWDLMEPFRAPLTEGLAAHLFNAHRLRPEMFSQTPDRTVIDPAGRRALVQGYESAVGRVVNAPGRKIRLAWRPMMVWKAQRLAESLRAGEPDRFTPYHMEP